MKLTGELKGMESRVAGVQALAAARAQEAEERREKPIVVGRWVGVDTYDRSLSKHRFVAYYHAAKRGLLHLI